VSYSFDLEFILTSVSNFWQNFLASPAEKKNLEGIWTDGNFVTCVYVPGKSIIFI
jgi:hypothetical protein